MDSSSLLPVSGGNFPMLWIQLLSYLNFFAEIQLILNRKLRMNLQVTIRYKLDGAHCFASQKCCKAHHRSALQKGKCYFCQHPVTPCPILPVIVNAHAAVTARHCTYGKLRLREQCSSDRPACGVH
ncbi:unnamed protein product [Nesidiocoris tenuis]|uniref:Uncharacterized protein n=1 Tax=Nesidiocoris tenuis TaxID=355587 RepID=A0A6H5GIK9_9HEMI|nr:unnamed protein product [Nesidiocoris tenuis]